MNEWRPYSPPLHPLARAALLRAHALAVGGTLRERREAPRVLAAIPARALPHLERVRLACAIETHASYGARWYPASRAAVTRAACELLAECWRLAGMRAALLARAAAFLTNPSGNR